jgi:hypothetical protein
MSLCLVRLAPILALVCTTACDEFRDGARLARVVKKIDARPPAHIRSGIEESVYVVVSASCAASQDSAFKAAARRLIDSRRRAALAAGHRFAVIGISTDWTLSDGLAALTDLGRLDEVVVGRNWINKSYGDLLRGLADEDHVTPTVIVTRRSIELVLRQTRTTPDSVVHLAYGSESVRALSDSASSESP